MWLEGQAKAGPWAAAPGLATQRPVPMTWPSSQLGARWPGSPATWIGRYAFRIGCDDELVINYDLRRSTFLNNHI